MLKYLKDNWKTILIVLLSIMYIGKCASSGNYKRKLAKEVTVGKTAMDSIDAVMSSYNRQMDSLKNVIRYKDIEISNLNSTVHMLNEQNDRLAKKPVIVKVKPVDNEQ